MKTKVGVYCTAEGLKGFNRGSEISVDELWKKNYGKGKNGKGKKKRKRKKKEKKRKEKRNLTKRASFRMIETKKILHFAIKGSFKSKKSK